MAIRGLTDSIKPAFPCIGKLRKGGEKTASGFGKELDYWRFTSDRPEVVEAFKAVYGDRPRLVNVFLPYASIDDNFEAWKEHWAAGGLRHRCDGQNMVIWLGPDGKYHREPKPCTGGCDEVARLSFIVPELVTAGHIGYVTMESHSINDIRSIYAVLTAIADARANNPLGLRGVQCVLRRVPEKISVPGFGNNAGKRQRVEKWLAKLEPAASWVENQLALQRAGQFALPSGAVASLETGEIVEDDDDVFENEVIETTDTDDGQETTDASDDTELVSDEETTEVQWTMSLDEACRVTTKKGSAIGTLSYDQLQTIIDTYSAKTTIDDVEQKILDAAKIVQRNVGVTDTNAIPF